MQEESFAQLHAYADPWVVNPESRFQEPQFGFDAVTPAKNLLRRLVLQSQVAVGDYDGISLPEYGTFNSSEYQDPRLSLDLFLTFAPGGLSKPGGRLNSGPAVLEAEDLEGLSVRSPRDGKSVGALQGRENRLDWLELSEFEPNQPAHVRGWLQNERRRLEFGNGGAETRTPPGYQMGHGRATPAREGYDYSNSRLNLQELNELEESVRKRSLE
jgi:hypothetical protein